MTSILIANRGEIAIRIARAARAMNLRVVGVCAQDDRGSLHTQVVDECYTIDQRGPAAYLNGEQLISVAKRANCSLLHPGYGFLSESAEFAQACIAQGLCFIGPSVALLRRFGDKAETRTLAHQHGVPVIPGTSTPTSLDQVQSFVADHGPSVIKAIAGGGGRGIRVVNAKSDIAHAYKSCQSEALASFGRGDLYIEKYLEHVRHIEVQLIGDGTGAVQHCWERDCSIQRRFQKLIELAPAPDLPGTLRQQLLDAALALVAPLNLSGLCTVEFLVNERAEFWLIEVNPRLQVEHTVTEAITSLDLVQAQIKIAMGHSLHSMGLDNPPLLTGCALQCRINAEGVDAQGRPLPQAGAIKTYQVAGGPGIRIDSYGYAGYEINPSFDSLLTKLIVHADTSEALRSRAAAALDECFIEGVCSNLATLKTLLASPEVLTGRAHTALLADEYSQKPSSNGDNTSTATASKPAQSASKTDALAGALLVNSGSEHRRTSKSALSPTDGIVLGAPMTGVITQLLVTEGDALTAGQAVAVIEAMKMEYTVRCEQACRVKSITVKRYDTVQEGNCLAVLVLDASDTQQRPSSDHRNEAVWAAEVAEIHHRRALAQQMGGTEKIAKQKAQGKLTARERVLALADADSFREIGQLAGFGQYNDDGELTQFTAANFIAGTATINQRKVMLGVDDFTGRGGSGDAAIHEKQIFSEAYAGDMRMPLIRLLDGASGGGSVKMAQELGFHYLPVNPAWDSVVSNLSRIPVVAACLGPTVGLGAARLAMSHLAIMVADIGQVFTAGPPVVLGATREELTKEQLGGSHVHRDNGLVERVVSSEGEAFTVIKDFLSYLPQSVYGLPNIVSYREPSAELRQALLSAIPRNEREPYAISPILNALFDEGSVFSYAQYGASTVTALARLGGHPVGVITTDAMRGATMTAEGALAITRLVDLCESFHLPIVSLTDQAGMTIGLEAEQRGTVRYGARAIAAIYQANVPQAEIIMRRVYGVGGAGIVNRHRANRSWAWPSGNWGSLPHQGGIEAAFKAQLIKSDNPEVEIARITRELEHISSPFRTAEKFGVQDLIDPTETRDQLCDWVKDAYAVLPELVGPPAMGYRP